MQKVLGQGEDGEKEERGSTRSRYCSRSRGMSGG